MKIVGIRCGLGNQMFQYAYARMLREYSKDEVYIETTVCARDKMTDGNIYRPYGLQHFDITLPEVNLRKESKFWFMFEDSVVGKCRLLFSKLHITNCKIYNFDDKYYNPNHIQIKGDCYIKGWFQDARYFDKIRGILLKEFRPKKRIKLPKKLRKVLLEKETVALHVRRGDYKNANNVLESAYYTRAIQLIEQKVRNPVYLIFSDDEQWVKKNMNISGEHYFVSGNCHLKDYEELWVMSRCRHNIIANSTFSWWGAWLNRNKHKIVIAPSKWFEMQKDILPEEWIILK